MNSNLLLEHFGRVSAAPEAIPRLRTFILDLAVRGKLVEQNLRDVPALSSLEPTAVQTLGTDVNATKAVSKTKILAPSQAPHLVPGNWIWVSLGSLCTKTGSGSTPRGGKSVYQKEGVPFLRSQNIHNDGLRLDKVAFIAQETHEKMSGTAVMPGDLLLNITGGSIGRCCLVPIGFGEANVSQHVAIIRARDTGIREYLHRLIQSPYFQSFVFSKQTGAGRGGLPKNRMDRIPIALPPLPEQKRIVSRIAELMDFCNRLERAQEELDEQKHRFVATTHLHLTSDENEFLLRERGKLFIENLPRLTADPGEMKRFRQTVLSLAVCGRLVSQESSDGAAREQLTSIQSEKARRISAGELRREKATAPVAEEEEPFSIPTSWSWSRIGTCALMIDYGTSVKSEQLKDGVPVLAMGHVQDGHVIVDDRRKVPRDIEDLPKLFLRKFDLLYNRTNSAELVGKTGIYLADDDAYTFASYLIRIRLIEQMTDPSYFNLAMNAPYFRQTQILPEIKQQNGQANVNGSKLRNMLIPLPPLAEQHRIVAKVAELMSLCDRLESQLTTGQIESRRLLEAVLHASIDNDRVPDRALSVMHG